MSTINNMATAGDAVASVNNVIFGFDPIIVSSIILVVSFALIISEKVNRAVIAMLGAALMVLLGVLTQDAAIRGIDFNTIALLIGMMIIVSIAKNSGLFQFTAIYSAKIVRGQPKLLFAALCTVTAVFSALLNNVTTVMLVVPVTILLCEQLKLKAMPFLLGEIFASNIGGTATLIGDPPNIMIGSAVNLSFMDFIFHATPVVIVIHIVTLGVLMLLFGRGMVTSRRAIYHLMKYVPAQAISDYPLLYKSLFVLAVVILGFIFGGTLGLELGTIALAGAGLLLLLDNIKFHGEEESRRVHTTFANVEWITIFFFVGLFIIVYGFEHSGAIHIIADKILSLTQGDVMQTTFLVLWSSAILSALIDNIPFVATMIPLIQTMAPQLGGAEAIGPIWWALALGACLGGNGTLIGASANLTVAGLAERAGQPITFVKFALYGFPLMLLSIGIAHIYIMLRYF